MRTKQIERWATKYILPELPGCVARGNQILATPVGLVHRFIVLDSSPSDPTVFSHIWIAAMPLWMPFPAVALSYSHDLLRPDRDAQGPVRPDNAHNVFAKIGRLLKARAPEVFDRIGTPQGFLAKVRDFLRAQCPREDLADATSDPEGWARSPLYEHLTGAAVLVGDVPVALTFADRFIRANSPDDTPRARESVDRLRRLATLAQEHLPRARQLLREWDSYSVARLKLEAHLDPHRWAPFEH